MKVTIVTCTYNSEKFLEKCLSSVESQTYQNIEHVFNDSYSSDRTLKIIEEYTVRNKDRYPIKFMSCEPKGVANALNMATPLATGDVIHYLHSDDYYKDSQAIERVVRYFKNEPELKWITGNYLLEIRDHQIEIPFTHLLKLNTKRLLYTMNFIHHENTFVKTDIVRKYGGFDEENGAVVEYRLWLRLIEDYTPKIVDDSFTVFIVHKDSTSSGSVIKLSKAILRAFNTQRKEGVLLLFGPSEKYKKLLDGINNLRKEIDFNKFPRVDKKLSETIHKVLKTKNSSDQG